MRKQNKVMIFGLGFTMASLNAQAVETVDVEDVTVEVFDASGTLPQAMTRTLQLPQSASEKAREKAADGLAQASEARTKAGASGTARPADDASEAMEKLRGLDRAQEARAQAAEQVAAAKERAQQAKMDAQQQAQAHRDAVKERGKSGK